MIPYSACTHCKEHCVYPLILRSYKLEFQYSYHHTQSAYFSTLMHLAPHPYLHALTHPFVLADLLVSHLNHYESAYFGSACAPYI